ncbi:MAG: adenosylcobinamide-GDP ribazoletransferase [Oscillospiraceae bacterium]|nr:adenosylcobinamide-GDP ribazoletransferase [Oscillospiraceae bacterium]MBR2889976.1 adenosylcobinamide-GDP ribazoletransferase [Oscillospiraceae bacterium]
MKTYLHAFAMCQSMFCAIPAPQIWDEKAKDKMLLFLPLVGLEIGAIWAGLAWLCRFLELPGLITGLILCAWPYLGTGFLHLDGFMDVTDAVKSWRDLERRRAILKDSHVGSFAVIGIVLLILAQFACFASVPAHGDFRILLFVPAVSRCCSSLAVTGLKPMSTSQYADRNLPRSHLAVLGLMLCGLLAGGFLLCGNYGFVCVGCVVGYGFALRRGYCSLEGMNGDISGYALTIGELCAGAVYALL